MVRKRINGEDIIKEIKNNNYITQNELAELFLCETRTIRRHMKKLKDKGLLSASGSGITHKWIIKG